MLSCAVESGKLKTISQAPLELRFQTKPTFLWSGVPGWEFDSEMSYVGRQTGPGASIYYAGVDLTKGDVILEPMAVVGVFWFGR